MSAPYTAASYTAALVAPFRLPSAGFNKAFRKALAEHGLAIVDGPPRVSDAYPGGASHAAPPATDGPEAWPVGSVMVWVNQPPAAVRGVMVCGVDCRRGDKHCNGYCSGDAPRPAPLTAEMTTAQLGAAAHAALQKAEAAWHLLYAHLPVGPDRTHAADVFERIRNATRRA